MAGDDRPWYEEAFREDYLALYPHRDLDAARSEAAGLVERGVGGRTLDLCCGFGRHAAALLELGVDVYGMDLSAELLARVSGMPRGDELAARVCRGDARALPFAPRAFDSLVMLFSSFGYFDEAGNGAVLAEIARVVRARGLVVLDLMNAARVREGLVPESVTERGGESWIERRRLTDDGRRVLKDVLVRGPSGGERRWHEDVRLFDAGELPELLARHGLAVDRVEGDFDGAPFAADSPRQLVWSHRVA